MKYIAEKRNNDELNGVELYFTVYPLSGTRETLKKHGFRWNRKKSCWYARRSMMADEVATICAETTVTEYQHIAATTGETVTEVRATAEKKAPAKKAEKKPAANKYGVKVGDFFSMSWGYEQTNNTFFQVVALVGASSVRVRQVNPPIVESTAVSSMSEDRVYKLDRSVLLPAAPHTVFIDDQENGDLKRLKSYAADGVSNPQICMASFADAHYCNSDTEKTYESWYY